MGMVCQCCFPCKSSNSSSHAWASAFVTHVCTRQDMDLLIKSAHDGWMGTKKLWASEVWSVVAKRKLEGSLFGPKYTLPPQPEPQPEVEEKPKESKNKMPSPFQERVNEPEAVPEISAAFPRATPVESNPVSMATKPPSEATEDEELKAAQESHMQRWTEMIESIGMLEQIDWLDDMGDTQENRDALIIIFMEGMNYCKMFMDGCLLPWRMENWPMCPRVWLGEFERCLKHMAKRNILPYWLKRPHDRNIREDASEGAEGFSDPGNYILDQLVHCWRLWHYCEGSRADMVIKQSIHEYGHRANQSSKGPVNLRGNIVEAMTKNLQTDGSKIDKGYHADYDPMWWTTAKPPQEKGSKGHWHSSASSSWSSGGWKGKSSW